MKKYIIMTSIITAITTTTIIFFILNFQGYKFVKTNALKENEIILKNEETMNNKTEEVIKQENVITEKENTKDDSIKNETTENIITNQDEKNEYIPPVEEEKVEPVYIQGEEVIGYIKISKYNVDAPIFKYANFNTMNISVAVAYGQLNEVGNTIIFGNVYENYPFEKLSQLEIGDKVIITDLKGNEITYEVFENRVVDRNDTSYFKRDTIGSREITMHTGAASSDERTIVLAREVKNN